MCGETVDAIPVQFWSIDCAVSDPLIVCNHGSQSLGKCFNKQYLPFSGQTIL